MLLLALLAATVAAAPPSTRDARSARHRHRDRHRRRLGRSLRPDSRRLRSRSRDHHGWRHPRAGESGFEASPRRGPLRGPRGGGAADTRAAGEDRLPVPVGRRLHSKGPRRHSRRGGDRGRGPAAARRARPRRGRPPPERGRRAAARAAAAAARQAARPHERLRVHLGRGATSPSGTSPRRSRMHGSSTAPAFP